MLAKYLFPGDKIHPQEYSNSPLPAHQMPHSPLQAHYTPRAGCLAWHVCDAVFAPASPSSYTHGLSLLSPVSANLLPVLRKTQLTHKASLFSPVERSLPLFFLVLIAFCYHLSYGSYLLCSCITSIYAQKRHPKCLLNWFGVHLTDCLWSFSVAESSCWNLNVFVSGIIECEVLESDDLVQTPPSLRWNSGGCSWRSSRCHTAPPSVWS